MRKRAFPKVLIPIYAAVLIVFVLCAYWGNHAVTVFSEQAPISNRTTVIVDAGHGGVDGGATSCSGVLESSINLDIAIRLNDLLHLLGIDTVMTRATDTSIHTQGNTIAAMKVSDLKNRVKIANSYDNAVLISIHQNYFEDEKYSGAQVFYADTPGSSQLAKSVQSAFAVNLNDGNKRQSKQAKGVYLMEHISCTGILIECGFLSNREEEAKLLQECYQKKLCSVIASQISTYLHQKQQLDRNTDA